MRISDWSSDVCSSDLKRFAGKEDACGFVRFAHHCAVHPASGVSSLEHLHPANAAATAPATHGDRSASGGDHRAKDRLIGFATVASVEPQSEEDTSAFQTIMRNSYADLRLTKTQTPTHIYSNEN